MQLRLFLALPVAAESTDSGDSAQTPHGQHTVTEAVGLIPVVTRPSAMYSHEQIEWPPCMPCWLLAPLMHPQADACKTCSPSESKALPELNSGRNIFIRCDSETPVDRRWPASISA